MAAVEKIISTENFGSALSSRNLVVVHFAAHWADQCGQVTDVMEELAKLPEIAQKGTKFYICPAEDLADISFKYKVDSVPTVILFRNGKDIDRIEGADVAQLSAKVKQQGENGPYIPSPLVQEKEPLNVRLKKLVNRHKVMVFMKGTRDAPRCGFSKQLMQILKDLSVNFDTFDILTDEEVRQGLKTYSDWPTYPQVYVNGDLIGGLDIVKEMQASGELEQTLNGDV